MKPLMNRGALGNRKTEDAPSRCWKKLLLAGSMLAGAGCGGVEMDNFIPMPSKKDGPVSDLRRDGGILRDGAIDARRDKANADLKKLSDATVPDKRVDSRSDFRAADFRVADMVSADACVSASGLLSCSNSTSLASGWLSLGGTMDLKGGLLPMSTYYRVRFEGVETLNGVASAHLSILDLCGKVKVSLKIAGGASKQVALNGQQLDISVENISSGVSSKDGGLQGATAKISVSVPCNLDSGLPDAKKGDYKTTADSKPKSDYKAQADASKKDGALKKDSALVPDSKHGTDAAKGDAKQAADSKAQKNDAGVYDAAAADLIAACPQSSVASFSGLVYSGKPKTVGGYSFDYKGKAGIDAIFDISCGGAAIVSGKKCPLGADTVIGMAQDGKSITISPIAAGASVVNATISVGAI